MIKIGFSDVGIFDRKKSRTVFQMNGTLIFNGKADFGHGCKISINNNGKFICGNNLTVTAESQFICSKKITIGNDCLFSWDNLIMDTDFHHVYNKNNQIVNENKKLS